MLERAFLAGPLKTSQSESLEIQSLAALTALAQPTRLATFRLLVAREPDGMASGAIAQSLQAPQNTISAHLNVLTHAGLVSGARRGRSIVYRANLRRMHSLIAYLASNCCQVDPACEPEAARALAGPSGDVPALGEHDPSSRNNLKEHR